MSKVNYYFKQHQIIAVPTLNHQKSFLTLFEFGSYRHNPQWKYSENPDQDFGSDANHTPHHLYVVTDEPINEGDWYISTYNEDKPMLNRRGNSSFGFSYCKKVIATTNKDLFRTKPTKENERIYYPMIDSEFVKNYIQLANHKLIINTIGVKYKNERFWLDEFCDVEKWKESLSIYNGNIIFPVIRNDYQLHEVLFLIENCIMSTHTKKLNSTPERFEKIRNWELETLQLTFKEIIVG